MVVFGSNSGANQHAVLEEHSRIAHVAPMFIAFMYEQAGDDEKAIDWYEIAYEKRDPDAPYMAVITMDRAVHSNPRFIQLLQSMKHFYWAALFSQGADAPETADSPTI
jgi:TPR repeat protein